MPLGKGVRILLPLIRNIAQRLLDCLPYRLIPAAAGIVWDATNLTRQLHNGAGGLATEASGVGYRGMEKAVLWNLGASDPADWKIIDLTDFFAAQGLLGGFGRLARAYSVTVDANGDIWVAGWGVWTADLTRRAFVAMVSACAIEPCCATPFADMDADGDVDQHDFARFQVCYTGVGGRVPPGCACLNRDGQDDIAPDDYAQFLKCVTGPEIPWSPLLTPDCVP